MTAATFLLAVAGLLAGLFEWRHYEKLLRWRDQDLSFGDELVLLWVVGAKTLWLMLPLGILSVGLLCLGRRRLGHVLLALNAAGLSTWLILDLRVQEVTGNHVAAYLSYVDSHDPLEWAGGAPLARDTCGLLAGIALATVLLLFALRWLLGRLARRWTPATGRRVLVGVLGLLLFVALGWRLGVRALDQPLLLEPLARALPVRLPGLEDASSAPADLAAFREEFSRGMHLPLRRLADKLFQARPVDASACVQRTDLPNVIILVLESFRHDALCGEYMPQLDRWSRRGLRFERHYAGSNSSHFGLFGLLYGRSPMVYDASLNAAVPPQMVHSFRNSGYRCSFLSGGTVRWCRMDEFINDRIFDEVRVFEHGSKSERDRIILRGEIERILRRRDRPQLIVAFLMATHYDYDYPPEYERHRPVLRNFSPTDARLRLNREPLFNRYKNSLAFLDDEISHLIGKLAPGRNLILVTGDHGESFWDDGVFLHSSRGSDIQTRVPLALVGPGVPARTVTDFTRHPDILPTLLHALAGQPVPVRGAHGKDVLAPDFRSDRVALFPAPLAGEGFRLLLLHGPDRLRVHLRFDRSPRAVAEGYYDVHDNFEVNRVPATEEAARWRHVLVEELRRVAQ